MILFLCIGYDSFLKNTQLQVDYLDQCWVLHNPNTTWDMLFSQFLGEKLNKARKSKKFVAKFSKNCFFLSLHWNTSQGFSCFFFLFSANFDLSMKCAEPKCWSKYTTVTIQLANEKSTNILWRTENFLKSLLADPVVQFGRGLAHHVPGGFLIKNVFFKLSKSAF